MKRKIAMNKRNKKNKQMMLNPPIDSLQTNPTLTGYKMNCLKVIAKANVSVGVLEEM